MPHHVLPVIDLASPDREALHHAARDVGFFQLVGHGITPEESAELLGAARAFFRLPEAERFSIDHLNSPHFRGYTRTGTELTQGSRDWRDQLDIAAERPARIPGPTEPAYWWLEGPNQWPAAAPRLREISLNWLDRLSSVGLRLLHALLGAIGGPEDFYDDEFTDRPRCHLKLIRYPGGAPGAGGQGVGAHKDYGFLTLLLTDGTAGLQVEPARNRASGGDDAGPAEAVGSDGSDDGSDGFLDVTHQPGAFVVNLGEMLEVATNGYLRATNHRVVSPPGGRERYSAAFFFNPRLDARIDRLPFPQAALTTGVTRDPRNPLFAEFGWNELKGWVRAHPDVAAKHHPQLLNGGWPPAS